MHEDKVRPVLQGAEVRHVQTDGLCQVSHQGNWVKGLFTFLGMTRGLPKDLELWILHFIIKNNIPTRKWISTLNQTKQSTNDFAGYLELENTFDEEKIV